MQKYFYTKKDTDKLMMFSDKKNKVDKDILVEHKINVTKEKLEDIDNGKITHIKNKKFIIKN